MKSRRPLNNPDRAARIAAALTALVLITLLLRTWRLDSLPPYLWWDEASQGLDARDLLHGHFSIFFSRALGKEPLYIYLTTPFVAWLDGTPLSTRLAGALLGALTVPALFWAARALWPDQPRLGLWTGLIAGSLWAVNFWPQSINRIGFQVNTFPLVLTVAVTAWLNWCNRPDRRRAGFFGFMAGLTLYTYLAARITPLLWIGLFLALPTAPRTRLRPTLPIALGAFGATVLPLMLYFVANPAAAMSRISTVGGLTGGGPREIVSTLVRESALVAGAFTGFTGDPLLRHNIPGRAPFTPVPALLVGLGVTVAVWTILRRGRTTRGAWTLLLWLALLCVPAILAAEDNPHFTRLFGALPAALLLAGYPPAWFIANRPRRPGQVQTAWMGGATLAFLLLVDGLLSGRAYFDDWAKRDLYPWYQGDYWEIGEFAAAHKGGLTVVPVLDDAYSLEYAFPQSARLDVRAADPTLETQLQSHTAPGGLLTVALWDEGVEKAADARGTVTFYAAREGAELEPVAYRRNTLHPYQLGDTPQFTAPGQSVAVVQDFGPPGALASSVPTVPSVTLAGVRWGGAFPNADRSAADLAAGTALWAILTWDVHVPNPALRVAKKLVDGDGRQIAPSDEWLWPERLPVADSTAGNRVNTYHLLQVPVTQPPGAATLRVKLYDDTTLQPLPPIGQYGNVTVDLATATIVPPLSMPQIADVTPSNAVAAEQAAAFSSAVTILGSDSLPATLEPGSTLVVRLLLQMPDVTPSPSSQTETALTLAMPDADLVAAIPLPTGSAPGQIIHLFARLPIPPTLSPGRYPVALGAGSGRVLPLGEVLIDGRPYLAEAPAIAYPVVAQVADHLTLLGVDSPVPLEVRPGEPLPVTLIWQVEESEPRNLIRFVHVLKDDPTLTSQDALVAQEDTTPCRGTCPSRGWRLGEVLLDEAGVLMPADAPPGDYRLAVGWYDAATGTRLPIHDGAGERLADDLLVLPLPVVVTAEGP